MDEVLELNRDTLAAAATIHEWINSFAPINRVLLDILSLIPTHFPSQNDRFRLTFVCRHWRRTFLRYSALWSHLCLSKGEVYVKTLLERAKGSPLSILVSGVDPVGTMMLFPPYTKQIADIKFTNNRWVDIQRFSEINSGPLPLLRTLNINVIRGIDPSGADVATFPWHPLFSGAVDLKELRLHSEGSPFLTHFVFPNLTSLELSVTSAEWFHGSQLLDFLEASPMLQVVDVKVFEIISLEGVPRERVVVLHNVKSLCLTANDGGPGYKLPIHILCPSIRNTSLTYTSEEVPYDAPPLARFPASDSLNAIIRQYTRSPIEEVKLEIITEPDRFIAYSLTFQSADTTTIKFRFQVNEDDVIAESFSCDAFSKACRAIRDLPLLATIKRLHINGLEIGLNSTFRQIAPDFGGLFESLSALEELTICHCDMPSYSFYYLVTVGPFPPVGVLTLFDLWTRVDEHVVNGLVRLAETQHVLGVPFERVKIRSYLPLADIEERLRPWVGVVDYMMLDRPSK